MNYADISLKKVSAIAAIAVIIIIAVSGTAATWVHEIGTFSIPGVELAVKNGFSSWEYRLQFNWKFGSQGTSGARSLLAMVGLTTISGNSEIITPSNTTAQAIPVLLYHGIVPVSTGPDETTIANFKAQMFALKSAGWQTVTIEQFVAAMKGQITLPPKSFLLTFDDGRQDAYYNATPILGALGYKAVMYVITGHSLATNNAKSKYYVTEDQLQDMLNSNVWELQSHSDIGHAQYPIDASGTIGDFFGDQLWIPSQATGESSSTYADRVYSDLQTYFDTGATWDLSTGRQETTAEYQSRIATDLLNAKTILQQKLGVNAISFAYPYNDFANDLKNNQVNGVPILVNFVNQIYDVSFYQWYPSLGYSENYAGLDGQLLRRIEPQPDWTPDHLLTLLGQGQPKALPYSLATGDGNDGWTQAWGNVSQNSSTLLLSASSTSAGASTILDGTRTWTNYTYSVNFDWQNAESVSLFARYQANPLATDYLACNFSDGSVRLEDHENGATAIIAQKNLASIGPGSNDEASIEVNGGSAACLWSGSSVITGAIPSTAPQSGGIGIEIWNSTVNNAAVKVNDVAAAYNT